MKISHLLSCGVLVGLMTMVGGAVVSADNVAPASAMEQAGPADNQLLAQLNAEPTFSDSTLRRPF